jgi:hypothetical protein
MSLYKRENYYILITFINLQPSEKNGFSDRFKKLTYLHEVCEIILIITSEIFYIN